LGQLAVFVLVSLAVAACLTLLAGVPVGWAIFWGFFLYRVAWSPSDLAERTCFGCLFFFTLVAAGVAFLADWLAGFPFRGGARGGGAARPGGGRGVLRPGGWPLGGGGGAGAGMAGVHPAPARRRSERAGGALVVAPPPVSLLPLGSPSGGAAGATRPTLE